MKSFSLSTKTEKALIHTAMRQLCGNAPVYRGDSITDVPAYPTKENRDEWRAYLRTPEGIELRNRFDQQNTMLEELMTLETAVYGAQE
jgi:hypothetical protein